MLKVTGNSVVNISGALIKFSGTGSNVVNITNTLCGGSCVPIGGLNVKLQNDALSSNVSISNPIKNSSLGSVNLSSSSNAAHVVVDGASSKVTISGN